MGKLWLADSIEQSKYWGRLIMLTSEMRLVRRRVTALVLTLVMALSCALPVMGGASLGVGAVDATAVSATSTSNTCPESARLLDSLSWDISEQEAREIALELRSLWYEEMLKAESPASAGASGPAGISAFMSGIQVQMTALRIRVYSGTMDEFLANNATPHAINGTVVADFHQQHVLLDPNDASQVLNYHDLIQGILPVVPSNPNINPITHNFLLKYKPLPNDNWLEGVVVLSAIHPTDTDSFFGVPFPIWDVTILHKPNDTPPAPAVPVTNISVQGTSGATSIDVQGATLQMNATVLPSDATTATVTWSVDDPNVAVIDSTGMLTAVSDGTVVVRATATDGSDVFGELSIAITNQSSPPSPQPPGGGQAGGNSGGNQASNGGGAPPMQNPPQNQNALPASITLSNQRESTPLRVGAQRNIRAQVNPANVVNSDVTWTSSAPRIASVNASGQVRGVRPGRVIITATSVANPSVRATATLTIESNPTAISASVRNIRMRQGTSLRVPVVVRGATNIDVPVAWTTQNRRVATLSSNNTRDGGTINFRQNRERNITIRAQRPGTSRITLTAENGRRMRLNIAVVRNAEALERVRIRNLPTNNSMRRGATRTLTLRTTPNRATLSDRVVWRSSNTDVATIDGAGRVTAHRSGETTITLRVGEHRHRVVLRVR